MQENTGVAYHMHTSKMEMRIICVCVCGGGVVSGWNVLKFRGAI